MCPTTHQPTTPFQEAVKRINEVTDATTRGRLANALAASLRFDVSGNTPPQVMSADGIATEYRVDPDSQDHYGIVLRRKAIKDFVKRYGIHIKSSDVTRKFKTAEYESFFGKPIPRLVNQTAQSATVYTYAEVLQRLGRTEQIMPDEVIALFTELKIKFP